VPAAAAFGAPAFLAPLALEAAAFGAPAFLAPNGPALVGPARDGLDDADSGRRAG